ncbi:hypothetical protein K4K59_005786 [Colletotrichum sp. SAR11_240]|nr:hypothetical protein K4K59_005786 [Colletotrichum sp. SAR11_240]
MPHHRDKANPGGFAYGKSRYIRENVLKKHLDTYMTNLRKSNRTEFEKKTNKLRPIILVTWASRCEEETLQRLDVNWFHDEGVTAVDLQQHPVLRAWAASHGLNPVLKAETACAALGVVIDTKRPRRGGSSSLAHNAGNDAAHTLQKFLIMGCLNNDQKEKLCKGEYLPRILPRWNYSALEEANPDPATGRPRPHGTDFNRVNIRREVKEEILNRDFHPEKSEPDGPALLPVAPVAIGAVPNGKDEHRPRRQLRPVAPVAIGPAQDIPPHSNQYVEFRLPVCANGTRYDFVRSEHRGRWDDQEQWVRMSTMEWEVAVRENVRLGAWRELFMKEEARLDRMQGTTDSDDDDEEEDDEGYLPRTRYHV